MLFTEFRFLLFFTVVWTVYWALRCNTKRKLLLLGGSYLFYGAWDYRFLGLILLSTLVDHVAAGQIDRSRDPGRRRAWLGVSLVTNLGLLFFFKYFNFFADSLVALLSSFGMAVSHTTLEIVLPVGISFYTFQTLSYTIDVYLGKLKPRESLLDLALFVAFFPQLVAGPIVRASSFLPQLDGLRRWPSGEIRGLLLLFLFGYVKKVCISDNIAPTVDLVFATPTDYAASAIVYGVVLYSIQIYCDFSGYSDMAIACAGLLGFRLPVNFKNPYFAENPTEFWRRWHISLSTWLRDYLYVPLGGGRNGAWQTRRNLMLTMLLGGLWHGAAWSFVVWGFLHGIALILHKAWGAFRQRHPRVMSLPPLINGLLTYYWVCIAWIFFRAESMAGGMAMLRACVFGQSAGQETLPLNAPAVFLVVGAVHWLKYRHGHRIDWNRGADWSFSIGLGVLAAVAIAFSPPGYHPFIYFQF